MSIRKVFKDHGVKVLTLDIETAPLLAFLWHLYQGYVSHKQIVEDLHMLSWAAHWAHEPQTLKHVMYADQRKKKGKAMENDSALVVKLAKLIEEADIVITQNGEKFDARVINGRLACNGKPRPSSFKHRDTCKIAKKHLKLPSYSLEYMANKFNKKFKKLTDERKFHGHKLWDECRAGNLSAWREMEKYNKFDVLATEELYLDTLIHWDDDFNVNLYTDCSDVICSACGAVKPVKNGTAKVGQTGVYQRYQCGICRKELGRGTTNLLTKEKKKSLLRRISRNGT